MRFHVMTAHAPLEGVVRVPGDKSISHRAVLFAALAQGTSQLSGVLDSADVRSTIAAVSALGARVELSAQPDGSLAGSITGWGERGPVTPAAPVDCGNSGTTVRLLMGVLAGWPGLAVTLTGDESLSRRPMRRVTEPLSAMGAVFEDTDGHVPVTVTGADLAPVAYATPVPSAQVKTAVLLAGLRAPGRTTVSESAPSRDHTERMLPAFDVAVGRDERALSAWVDGPVVPRAADVAVPADPSSAAFLACAAAIVPGSRVTLSDLALNPTRTGFLEVLKRMGVPVEFTTASGQFAEESADVTVSFAPDLSATLVEAHEVPSLIDEIPVLAVVAARAAGTTRFEGVGELRVKESDRLEAVRAGLAAVGVAVRVDGDALEVDGPAELRGAALDSLGDHRLAMAWAIAGLVLEPGQVLEIDRFDAVEVSYPGFAHDLESVGAR